MTNYNHTRMIRFSPCIEMLFNKIPFIDRIDAIADAGFPAFEFWGWRSKDVDGISKRRKEYGLAVSAFGVDPSGRIVDESAKKEFMEGLNDSIVVAQKLECSRLIVTTGNEMTGVSRKVQHDSITKSLKEASKIAEKADITIVLEPLNILVDHKGYYLFSSREGFDIISEVNSPKVRLLYDIYHLQIMEGNLIDTITKNINVIDHFHLADVPGRHEPGTGEINYANVLRRIDETGYDGFVGLEFMPTTDSGSALEKVMNILNRSSIY